MSRPLFLPISEVTTPAKSLQCLRPWPLEITPKDDFVHEESDQRDNKDELRDDFQTDRLRHYAAQPGQERHTLPRLAPVNCSPIALAVCPLPTINGVFDVIKGANGAIEKPISAKPNKLI